MVRTYPHATTAQQENMEKVVSNVHRVGIEEAETHQSLSARSAQKVSSRIQMEWQLACPAHQVNLPIKRVAQCANHVHLEGLLVAHPVIIAVSALKVLRLQ